MIVPDLFNLGYSDDLSAPKFSLKNHVLYLAEFFKEHVRPGAILVVQDWGGPDPVRLPRNRCRIA